MKRYERVPRWWFVSLLVVAFAMAQATDYTGHSHFTWWQSIVVSVFLFHSSSISNLVATDPRALAVLHRHLLDDLSDPRMASVASRELALTHPAGVFRFRRRAERFLPGYRQLHGARRSRGQHVHPSVLHCTSAVRLFSLGMARSTADSQRSRASTSFRISSLGSTSRFPQKSISWSRLWAASSVRSSTTSSCA
jgi:hypothetical protein